MLASALSLAYAEHMRSLFACVSFGSLAFSFFQLGFRHAEGNRLFGMILVLFSLVFAKYCFEYFVKWFREGDGDQKPVAKGAHPKAKE